MAHARLSALGKPAADMDRHTRRQTQIGVAIMILSLIAGTLVVGLLLGR